MRLIVATMVVLTGGATVAYGQDTAPPESRLRLPVIAASPRAAFFAQAPEQTARAEEPLRFAEPRRGSTNAWRVQENQPATPSGGGGGQLLLALIIAGGTSMGFLLFAP
jgi:hypothetical protein